MNCIKPLALHQIKLKKLDLNLFSKYLENKKFHEPDSINYWREKIMKNLLFAILLVGFAAYAFGVFMSIKTELYCVLIADTLAYGLLVFLFFTSYFSLKFRACVMLVVIFLLGMLFILKIGPYGAGLIYLVGFSILAAILLGKRAAYYSILINLISVIFIGIVIEFNWLENSMIHDYTTVGWITVAINVLVISSVSSIPLAALVDGLKQTMNTQKRLQTQLTQTVAEIAIARNKAEEADKLKSRFLANMSHEIRTPMNTILGFSDLIQTGNRYREEDLKQFMGMINNSGQYLIGVIDNILDISMIESNQLKLIIKPIKLSSIIADLKTMYDPRLKQSESIEVKFPTLTVNNDILLISDAHRIKQVFINLINNALKFTVQGEIKIGYAIRDQLVEFFVKDSGTGIAEKDLPNVFERYVKSDNEGGGTGLGLAISKGIIEALQGDIWVKSTQGVGSTFSFNIPLEFRKPKK